LFRIPVRVPVFVVAEAETVWMNFLTHNFLQSVLVLRSQMELRTRIYSSLPLSSDLALPRFDAFFSAAGFAAASDFGAVRFARGAAAAPPRFRPLLSA